MEKLTKEEIIEESWDKLSQTMLDSIDMLSYWAGRNIMSRKDFLIAMEEYGNQRYKEGFEACREKVEEGVKGIEGETYLRKESALTTIREIKP
jgi:hypothetical protein